MSRQSRQSTWAEKYRTKRKQNNQGQRCPGKCGRKPTQSHHLWARRPDCLELQHPINIVQACPQCHMEEGEEFQVRAALMKLWEYKPDVIETYILTLPGRAQRGLPSHYLQALKLYNERKRPFEDY